MANLDTTMAKSGFKQALPPLSTDALKRLTSGMFEYHGHIDDVTRAMSELLTVPSMPNYLGAYVPMRDSWTSDAREAYSRSMNFFLAEVWIHIAKRKTDNYKDINLIWNRDVPKPNMQTALFWLLNCEAWPLPGIHRGLPEAFSIGKLFPPQPFILPVSPNAQIANIQPYSWANSIWSGVTPKDLTVLLSECMTRNDRDLMSKAPKAWQPVYMPQGGITFGHHRRYHSTSERTRDFRPEYSAGFIHRMDADVIAGLARTELQESDSHLYHLQTLRGSIMAQTGPVSGLPTHHSAIYGGAAGQHFRPFAYSHSYVREQAHKHWTVTQDPIEMNGNQYKVIPKLAPRFWLGFTGQDLWTQNNDTCAPAREWCQAYLDHRSYAISMLFEPHLIQWDAHEAAHLQWRTDVLTKAGKLRKETPVPTRPTEATMEAARKAFAQFGKKD